jgi:cation diffusion facilitator CzcD-associated flavoprotein CzcO
MPTSYPEWPKGPQVHAYLSDYARSHGLDRAMRFNTTVLRMDRRADGEPGWTLDLQGQDGSIGHEDFDFVAICTGQFNEPQTISHRGEDAFRAQGGQILHSSQYNDAALAKGRKVVVLGGSKSATDIAVNAVNSGASDVTIVYREPVWRIPYFIGGLVNFKRILYIRAQEEMFRSWGIGPLSRLAHAIAKPLVWANWRGLESLLKLQLKLKTCDMVPDAPIEGGVNCSVPIATPGFFPMVADGRIKAIRGTFDHFDGRTIVMTGGQRVPADIAVLAIGYKLGVPFLPAAHQARLVDPDGQYRLYRLIANPDLPDMGFVGFNSSFCTVLCADLAAQWLVRYADGQLKHQPTADEMRDNIEMMLHFKRVERPAAGVYGGLCVAPYHYKHFDELLADIGATTRRRNPLAEKFTPPNADAYARFLASAPNYKAAYAA